MNIKNHTIKLLFFYNSPFSKSSISNYVRLFSVYAMLKSNGYKIIYLSIASFDQYVSFFGPLESNFTHFTDNICECVMCI